MAQTFLSPEEKEELIRQALAARELSYSPYSGYQVGAAVMTEEKMVYTGCNIENAAYSPTNCAERTAMFKAVSEGVRGFVAIAVAGSPKGPVTQYAFPCGVCRQVMREFSNPEQMLVLYPSTHLHKMLLYTLPHVQRITYHP